MRKGLLCSQRLVHTLPSLLFLGLAAASRSPARLPLSPLRFARVLIKSSVLGDSISAGYGLKEADVYPALLSEKAASVGKRLHVINAGVSGDTTAGGCVGSGTCLIIASIFCFSSSESTMLFEVCQSGRSRKNLQAIISLHALVIRT